MSQTPGARTQYNTATPEDFPCFLREVGAVAMGSSTYGLIRRRRLTTLDRIAATGLFFGAAFGLAGTLVESPSLQASLWAIDSVGLVIATALLALRYFRAGSDIVAGGYLVFAIGEGVLLSGTAAGPSGSVPAFAAGTGLWAAALALVSVPRVLPVWLRVLGAVAACLFAVTSASIYAGERLLPTSAPLPFVGYPFLVATLLGWAWMLMRERSP